MKKITYRLTLDMKRIESEPMVVIDDSITALSVFANGGESLVREVAVRLRSGASPYDLNGISAFLFGKADGRYFCDCDVRDDVIYCVLPDELTAEAVTLCEIRLTDGSGAVVTTPTFRVVSKKAIFSADAILRSNSFPALLTAIERADNARIVDSRIEQRELIITYGDGTEVTLGEVIGPMGPEGAAGPAGADGADGIDGIDGSAWHYGTLITGEGDNIFMPIAGAKAGDYYLNTDTGAVYVAGGTARSAEWWRYITTLAGEKGEAFTYEDFTPEQLEALRGPAGADGAPGKDGKDGINGRDGQDGYTPQKGVDYFDGKDGKDGIDGAAGTRFIAQAEKPTEKGVLWLDTDDDAEAPEGGGGTAQPMEKLTFTGAVEAEYDGSEPVTVEIPQGGGGGGEGTWEDICHITLEEAVNQVTYDIPDEYKEVFIVIRGLLATTNSGSIVAMDFTDTFKLAQSSNWLYTNNASRGAMAYFKLMAKNIAGWYTGSTVQFADTGWSSNAQLARNSKTLTENRFGTFKLWHSNGTFAAGFMIDIWGLKV